MAIDWERVFSKGKEMEKTIRQTKGTAQREPSPVSTPLVRGSSYLTGGAATPAPSYGAGVQARELKELDIKPREKKTSTPQKAQTPAWQGLMDLSAVELAQRHEKAKAERDALSGQVAREETPAAASSYAAVAGRYRAKEVNPIPSVAAASGAWVSEEDKRLAPLRMDVSKKQDEVNDLATAHYHRKNQEQFAKMETDAASKTKFRSAQELATDLDAVSKALSAPTTYNGQDTRFRNDGEAMKQKYGVNDLQALQRTLTAQKAELVKELEAKGYDFETMAGYDRTLKQQAEYIKRQEQTQKDAEEHPVWASGLSTILSPLQGTDFLRTSFNSVGHSDADDLGSYVPANVYDMHTTNMVQTIRGAVSKQIEENTDWEIFGQNVGSFLYNTGMSMADSALMVTTLGPGSTYLMGLSSAANKSKEIMEQGGSNQQAFWGGLTAGVAECVFEKFSVDNLLKIKKVDNWKSFIKAALTQGGIEASEEMLTECANIISDAMVMGERSGLSTAIKGYQEQGMTEDKAVLQACLDSIGQVAVAGAGGFISGVGMGAGKLGIEQGSQAIYDRLTQRGGEAVQFGAQQGEGARFDAQTGVVDTHAAQNSVAGLENATKGTTLIDIVRKSIPQVQDMTPVAEVQGSELPEGKNVIERLTAFINRVGNKVHRAGFGDVLFSKGKIKNSMLGHGMGTAKIETFAAVPDVIKHGKQIDFQKNWKGRGYDTYTFTAPVIYRGETTYLGVIVTKDVQDGRYYVHEVVDANGNLIFGGQENTAVASDGRASLSGTIDTVATTAFKDSIPQTAQDVNPETGQQVEKPGQTGLSIATAEPPAGTLLSEVYDLARRMGTCGQKGLSQALEVRRLGGDFNETHFLIGYIDVYLAALKGLPHGPAYLPATVDSHARQLTLVERMQAYHNGVNDAKARTQAAHGQAKSPVGVDPLPAADYNSINIQGGMRYGVQAGDSAGAQLDGAAGEGVQERPVLLADSRAHADAGPDGQAHLQHFGELRLTEDKVAYFRHPQGKAM